MPSAEVRARHCGLSRLTPWRAACPEHSRTAVPGWPVFSQAQDPVRAGAGSKAIEAWKTGRRACSDSQDRLGPRELLEGRPRPSIQDTITTAQKALTYGFVGALVGARHGPVLLRQPAAIWYLRLRHSADAPPSPGPVNPAAKDL